MHPLLATLLCLHLALHTQVMCSEDGLGYYFPELGGDMTKVTWEHAVNSREKLDNALKGDALMLEADVVFGYTSAQSRDLNEPKVVVMAHPPETVSNLTLQEFLEVFDASGVNKGIKLDFKSREAFSNSLNYVDKLFNSFSRDYPVWLNADIIAGPVNASIPVLNADYFLTTCISRYPSATISVGWTTYLEPGSTEGAYTQADLDRMTESLNKNMVITSPVTFAVRAALAARSVNLLANLIATSSAPSTSLTIWSSVETDVIDLNGLKKLINKVGKTKVYLDLPKDVRDSMRTEGSSGSPGTSLPNIAFIAATSMFILLFL